VLVGVSGAYVRAGWVSEIYEIYVHVLDKIRKNIFFGFIDYFYHIIDLFNRKFYL
jgi:hypothetical protein